MDDWQIDRLDLDGYLARVGVKAREPSAEALAELHEAHHRAFTFDNIDVLLDQHPGVSTEVLSAKFVERGRGGYCFEHASVFAAALERLGYRVTRRLGRVGDPPSQTARTHMVVWAHLDGATWLCDLGFGFTMLRPMRLVDGAEMQYLGWAYRVQGTPEGTWQLSRHRDQGWEVMHTHDELAVHPIDVVMGHHFTSTWPGSHFRHRLVVSRMLADRHVTITHDTVTVRRPGESTVHRHLEEGELPDHLEELGVPLTEDETERLLDRTAGLSPTSP